MSDEDRTLQWFKAVATAVSIVAIPVVVGFIGNSYSQAIKEREVQGKFVELAVEILAEVDTAQARRPIREWAIQVVNTYSGVPMSGEAEQNLREGAPLVSGVGSRIAFVHKLAPDDGPVRLTVRIGNAQSGTAYVRSASGGIDQTIDPGETIDLGDSARLIGTSVIVSVTALATNPSTHDIPIALLIESAGEVATYESLRTAAPGSLVSTSLLIIFEERA